MEEVKNSSIDLLTRQMTGIRKKDEKAVEGFSGFKNMLKGKNQKKNAGNEEAQNSGDKKERGAAEASAVLSAAGAVEAQKPDSMLRLMGQDHKTSENGEPGTVPGVMFHEGEKAQVFNQLQALNQLRFQNLTGKPVQEPGLPETEAAVISAEAGTAQSAVSLEDEVGKLGKASQKESRGMEGLGQAKGPGSDREGEDNIWEAKPLKGTLEEVPERKGEEAVIPVQREKTKVKPDFIEKDEKKQAENQEISRENFFEPNRIHSVQPLKEETAYVTVNAESLEGLESKLSQQIFKQIQAGRGELDVQLEPHNLGKIRIKVSYEDSQVSVSVLCSESRTLKLLSQSAGALGSILENNLERPVQILVDKQGTDYLDNQKEQGNGQEQHQPQHENRKEESREDFIQKLRLGIFETGNAQEMEIR